ncbi:MAG: hypothetical protein WBD20_21505, partial [Pirellulaceae bacterium]
PFRVQQNAASLKPSCHSVRPKHISVFPRSTERGFVEASFITRVLVAVSSAFRVQQNAASL